MKYRHNKCLLSLFLPPFTLWLTLHVFPSFTWSFFPSLCHVLPAHRQLLGFYFLIRILFSSTLLPGYFWSCLGHAVGHTYTWARTHVWIVCVTEWEGVSTILRSVRFDLFHLLLSHISRRPAGWSREGDQHTDTEGTELSHSAFLLLHMQPDWKPPPCSHS